MDTKNNNELLLERTPDNLVQLWVLYKPKQENLNPNDTNIYLWMREHTLHLSEQAAKDYIENLLHLNIYWHKHELFPELRIGIDNRGYRWFIEPVPIEGTK